MKIFKVALYLTFIIIFIPSCNTEKSSDKHSNLAYEYYPDGKLKSESQTKDGKANGIYKAYTPGGKLEKVFTYEMGKKEGPAVYYYPDGTLKAKYFYKDNKRDGIAKMYYTSGELYRITTHKEGMIDGIRKVYYKDGSLLAEAPYRNNFPGIGLKEYDKNGKLVNDDVKIIIDPVNSLAFENKYTLRLSLSKKRTETFFYIRDLYEGKYISKACLPVKPKNGVGEYSILLNKGGLIMETMTISAVYRTKKNNYKVISTNYNLAINNK